MKFTISTARVTGNEKNVLYPNRNDIKCTDDLISAAAFDHVCGVFKDSRRSVGNFISSDVIVLDCDNDHSDDPSEWISPEGFAEMMGKVSFALVPSRHNLMAKDGRTARPRFHVYFPINVVTDAARYAKLKADVQRRYPFFDPQALDAARFIYGNQAENVIWHDGSMTIDMTLGKRIIAEGSRNTTMSRFAGKVVKRYGVTDRAHEIFLEEAAKCEPPLPDEELSTIWRSAARFARRVQQEDGYVPPDEYEFQSQSIKPKDYSDIGQARALLVLYGDELLFTAATGYLRYDGTRWIESRQQAVGAMEEFLDFQLADAEDAIKEAEEKLKSEGVTDENISGGAKALAKKLGMTDSVLTLMAALAYKTFVMKRRDMKYVMSALDAAKPMVEIDTDELDHDGLLLNTPDATWYLPDGMSGRREHSAADHITKVTAVSPSEDGKDLWLDSLAVVFCGDAELIDYVQQIVGLAAIGKVYNEALIISYGDGRNGKSTFWNSIAGVLGSYSGSMSADTLTVGCKRNVKPELAEAKGKRLIIAAELEEGMRLNTSTIKQLCSTDRIHAEKKYKDPFTFTPTHTLVLYTNHLPRVGAIDEGTWRRLIVLPFNATIEGSDDIKNYADYLVKNAGKYILSWIIEGAAKVIRQGYHIDCPPAVKAAISEYRQDNDWLGHFFDECCELGSEFDEKSGKIYDEYRAFCLRTGEYVRNSAEFYAGIEQRGIRRARRKNGRYVLGIRLKTKDFTN